MKYKSQNTLKEQGKAKKLYNSSKNPLSFIIQSNVDMSAVPKGVSS